MAASPTTLSAAMRSTARADEVFSQLRRLPLGPSARFDQRDSSTLVVRAGSRLKYRLLGAWTARKDLPLELRFSITPREDGSATRMTMTSDEGRYLVQTSFGRDAYRVRFEELLAAMEVAGFVEES